MAEVANKSRSIDSDLDWSLDAWNELPKVAGELPFWEPFERLGYLYEWPLEEERLSELRAYARDGILGPKQADRLRELEGLVEENRPIIEDLQQRYIG